MLGQPFHSHVDADAGEGEAWGWGRKCRESFKICADHFLRRPLLHVPPGGECGRQRVRGGTFALPDLTRRME